MAAKKKTACGCHAKPGHAAGAAAGAGKLTAKDVPKSQIDFLVGRMHVGSSDADVAADIGKRVKSQPEHFQKLIIAYAIKSHHKNIKTYNDVMGGRIGRGRAAGSSRGAAKGRAGGSADSRGVNTLVREGVRVSNLGSAVNVTVSERAIDAWRECWPGSGLGGLRGVTFQFSKKNGDLIDIWYKNSGAEKWDGPALVALSEDAFAVAEQRLAKNPSKAAPGRAAGGAKGRAAGHVGVMGTAFSKWLRDFDREIAKLDGRLSNVNFREPWLVDRFTRGTTAKSAAKLGKFDVDFSKGIGAPPPHEH